MKEVIISLWIAFSILFGISVGIYTTMTETGNWFSGVIAGLVVSYLLIALGLVTFYICVVYPAQKK